MAYNCKIELNGILGKDAKIIEKDGKPFVALRLATRDSYPVKEGDTTVWKNKKESLWHDVLIFRPTAVEVAKLLKAKDRVEIKGTLSYRNFKGEDGYNHQEVSIIGGFIQKIESKDDVEPTETEIAAAAKEVARS